MGVTLADILLDAIIKRMQTGASVGPFQTDDTPLYVALINHLERSNEQYTVYFIERKYYVQKGAEGFIAPIVNPLPDPASSPSQKAHRPVK